MPLEMVYSVHASWPAIVYTTTGTSSATGALTFTLPAGMFTSIASVQATAVRDTANPTAACFALVRTFSTTSVAVQVFESKTTGVLLGGSTEGLEATTTATVVHLAVFGSS